MGHRLELPEVLLNCLSVMFGFGEWQDILEASILTPQHGYRFSALRR